MQACKQCMYLSIMLGFRTKFPYANTSIVEQNKLEDSGFPCYNFSVFLLNYCLKMLKTPSSIIATHFISKVAILLVWSCLFNVCYAQSDDASASVQVRVFLEGLIDSRIPLRITGLEQDTTIKLEDGNSPENMTEVEVTIEELSTQTTITITPEKEGVVSISTTSISLGFPRDGTTTRTATFTLTAENVGGTTVTISVRDNLGNEAEIKIQVVVDPPYPEMVRVPKDPLPAGSFTMGVPEAEKNLITGNVGLSQGYTGEEEEPQHEVNIPYAFEVGKYEVTRGEFAAFVAAGNEVVDNCSNTHSRGEPSGNWENPNWNPDKDFSQTADRPADHPVVCVSWDDAIAYVDWLSDETGHNYRLLTEAEWEYAARAGTPTPYHFGDINSLLEVSKAKAVSNANFDSPAGGSTVPVGRFNQNAWELHDVHGNVAEWVADCWHPNYGEDGMVDAPTDGSAWITDCTNNNHRVIRGGSWRDDRIPLRSAARTSAVKTNGAWGYGFRVALTPLKIISPVQSSILLHAGGDIKPTTQVEVSIKEIYTEETVTMTLRLDEGGDAVVSTNTITILPDGDSIDRSAAFTLSTTGRAGNTTVTLVVTDDRGYGDEVKIPVEVRAIPPLRITSPMQSSISLLAGGDIQPTTQVKVSIKGIYTGATVEVSLQLDEAGEDVVEISTTSIAIGPGSLDRSVDFDLETTGRAGTTTLTLIVRYDNLENTDTTIKIPVEVRAIPPLRISPREPIFLHVGEDIRPTTQVKVSIKGIYTEETVTMTLQLDEAGDKVVNISTTSIAIGSGSLDISVDFDLETTDENETGTTTLTLIVRYDNLENTDTTIKIRVEVRPIYPEMVRVSPGTFIMGAPSGEANSGDNERPQREVNINYIFEVGKYEVTRGQFAAFVNDSSSGYSSEECTGLENNWQDPGFTQTDDHPVVCVSWNNAQAYAKWLSEKTGHNYRLLTEAEWEYVARAETTTAYHFGNDAIPDISKYARYNSNGTIAVGSLEPNLWGLHDVHGNVWEWVEDCWADYTVNTPTDGSARGGCRTTERIVRRGGSWSDDFGPLRSANRDPGRQDEQSSTNFNGFRIAFTPLEITSPPSDRVELNITRRSGEEPFFAERRLKVDIEETHTDQPVTMTLQLDEGGNKVVSISTSSVTISTSSVTISTTSITIILPSNDSKNRTAEFTLTAVGEGNTTATLVAKDNLENMHTVKIPVVVEEVVIVDALTRLENDPFFDKMVRVPPGTFIMGSPPTEEGRDPDGNEGPQHEVTIPYAFEVGQYEVTRGQYKIFIEETGFRPADSRFHSCQSEFTWQDPRFNQTDDHPVVCIGWMDAAGYVEWLNTVTDAKETGREFRLLSEEEWEYAARAGTTSTYYFGDTISTAQANYSSSAGTVQVGNYNNPNKFGLYDVHGNVWEWVKDCVRGANYDNKPLLNGRAVEGCGDLIARVIRGGSWSDGAAELRSANRAFLTNNHNNSRGFRIARTIPLQIINYPSEKIDLRVRGGRLATTQVEVVIRKTDTNKPVTVELQLDDDSIVSTGSIEVLFRDDDNEQRTVRIPLTAKKEGNTTLTVVVTDDAGNKEEIEIRLAVAPSLKIVSQTSDEVNLVVRGGHLATTQVEVVIQKIPTEDPVTVSLQLDKEGESAVSGSTSSITLLSSDDNVQRTAKFTLSVESKGNTTLADSDGNTTLTVVVMDEDDNKKEIELRLAAIGGNTMLTVVVTDKDGNEEEIEIRVVVEAFLPEMVRVPPMGNPEEFSRGSADGDPAERPPHPVTISKPFEVGKYEVTRRQFAVFVEVTPTSKADVGNCGTENNWENPGFTQDNDHPVVCVSRYTAQKYVEWLSGLTKHNYRLLTEAEWEYAARAGTITSYHWGDNADRSRANFRIRNARLGRTTPVGNYGDERANDWGLHDVHGNAGEWVEDCWHPNYGEEDGMVDAPTDGSAWTEDCSSTSQKVWRGGSWTTNFDGVRSASRASSSSSDSASSVPLSRLGYNNIGFRVARDLP